MLGHVFERERFAEVFFNIALGLRNPLITTNMGGCCCKSTAMQDDLFD